MWMTSLLMGIFLTILLVDWISLLLLWTIGPLIALSAVFILGHDIKVNYGVIEDFLLFPFAIMAGVTFRYLTDRETKEKLHGILAAGGSIAHELRTPLLGIKSGVAGLKRYLPALFDGYELAKNHGLPVKKIRKAHYDALFPVLDRIEDETDYSNVIIDMLLMNAGKQKIDDQSFEWCSMRNTVKEAIERYPFGSEVEQNKVLFDDGGRDFMYKGSTTLMVHVLFNLLKNALYFISKAQKGVVTIRIEGDSSHHMLLFKDTGTGIPHNVLPHIFQRFYSSTEEGTGIGLSYCYRVVKSFGGHINCRSKEGAFTEFVLRFPKGEH